MQAMKKASNSNQSAPDYSGLSTEELLSIIAESDQKIKSQQRLIQLLEEQL